MDEPKEPAVLPGIPVTAGQIIVTPLPPRTVPAPAPGAQEERLPSTTTPEEDRTTASQRRVNLIWELTQATIAITITITVCAVNAVRSLVPSTATTDNGASQILSNAFFLIVGFYFSRTNHTKTGGVGNTAYKER